MTSARTSGAVSGAAQGAVYGSYFGPYGTLIGAGAGFILGGLSGGATDRQFANQQAWARYGSQMNYLVDMHNIQSRKLLAGVNALFAMKAGQVQSQSALAYANYNAANIAATTQYNLSLLALDLERVWEDEDLDLEQLRTFKERETGLIVADQAASGTIIGEGSNAEVVISQLTQRELDKVVIMHNADRQAADIRNQMAQGSWQGQVAINNAMFEGQLTSFTAMSNAKIQAASGLITNAIQTQADTYTANLNRTLRSAGIDMDASAFSTSNYNNMISGLFSAAGSGAQAYYNNKTPSVDTTITTSGYKGSPVTNYSSSSYRPRVAQSYGYDQNIPGSSLAVSS